MYSRLSRESAFPPLREFGVLGRSSRCAVGSSLAFAVGAGCGNQRRRLTTSWLARRRLSLPNASCGTDPLEAADKGVVMLVSVLVGGTRMQFCHCTLLLSRRAGFWWLM